MKFDYDQIRYHEKNVTVQPESLPGPCQWHITMILQLVIIELQQLLFLKTNGVATVTMRPAMVESR